jgi:hypothetical protein
LHRPRLSNDVVRTAVETAVEEVQARISGKLRHGKIYRVARLT